VGFPDETKEDFLETYRFLADLDISYLHVFTYSERANTLAAEMENIVPMEERRRRNEMLTILSEKKKRFFYEQHLHTERPVLWESSEKNGTMSGFTDNYVKIEAPYRADMVNQITPSSLIGINLDGNVVGYLPTFVEN
jgi:threonylcarbamoyladenosine tRNA methylthiotransferase MtaB